MMPMLSEKDIAELDAAAREILSNVGVMLQDTDLVHRLKTARAVTDGPGGRVRVDTAWMDDCLNCAPSHFTLYGRDEKHHLELGSGRTYFGNGGRVFQILDLPTGGFRPTLLRDVASTAALVEALEHIRFYVIACQAGDLAPEHYHTNDFYQALLHTSKHVMGGVDHLRGLQQFYDLCVCIANGEADFRGRPFASVITNPISPLTIDKETLKILEFCALRGIPVTCAPAPISGATAPASLAGTLAQLHAEALISVALVQFFAAGAPIMYGAVASTMDLRRMDLAMGSVEAAMINTGAVALAHQYHLPIYATAGLTDSKLPDVQAGFEKGVSNLLLGMAGADYVHLAAGMVDSGNSISYEQYIIDNEILGMIERMLKGIVVTPETLGGSCIRDVGPGGNFVLEDHTIAHMFSEFFYPDLAIRGQYDRWADLGKPTPLTRAREIVNKILDAHTNHLSPETVSRVCKAFPRIVDIEPNLTVHSPKH